jgi:hypothetical protein
MEDPTYCFLEEMARDMLAAARAIIDSGPSDEGERELAEGVAAACERFLADINKET